MATYYSLGQGLGDMTLVHARAALAHGAPLETVERRLMELQVNPEVIARLQQ